MVLSLRAACRSSSRWSRKHSTHPGVHPTRRVSYKNQFFVVTGIQGWLPSIGSNLSASWNLYLFPMCIWLSCSMALWYLCWNTISMQGYRWNPGLGGGISIYAAVCPFITTALLPWSCSKALTWIMERPRETAGERRRLLAPNLGLHRDFLLCGTWRGSQIPCASSFRSHISLTSLHDGQKKLQDAFVLCMDILPGQYRIFSPSPGFLLLSTLAERILAII